jgi:hypothetical protein
MTGVAGSKRHKAHDLQLQAKRFSAPLVCRPQSSRNGCVSTRIDVHHRYNHLEAGTADKPTIKTSMSATSQPLDRHQAAINLLDKHQRLIPLSILRSHTPDWSLPAPDQSAVTSQTYFVNPQGSNKLSLCWHQPGNQPQPSIWRQLPCV